MTDSGGSVTLHLLRHADAGDPEKWQGDDAVRPLSEKGVRQSERLGRHLARIGFAPDVILSSPKTRALQTAEIVAQAVGVEAKVDDRLGGGVSVEVVAQILRDAGSPRRAVLVGHDPDFSELLATFVDARSISMRKGALGRIDFAQGLRPGGGTLRWLLPPDALPKDG